MTTVTDGLMTLLEPRALPNFVETPYIQGMVQRALTYLAASFPVHFRGASGTGKTTLAMHVASRLGRPVVMLHGDEEFSTSDLVGGEHGYRMRKVIDNFIHSVLKTEEDVTPMWLDNRLTIAAKHGFTLIYDEFTRSRPEANNVFLAVLQEKMLDLPPTSGEADYLRVHPAFTVIFTSNSEEYAGVYRSQDALRDRMITLDLDFFDEETEIGITAAKSGLSRADAERIVRIVRALRESRVCEYPPTVRSCIMVARAMKVGDYSADAHNAAFRQVCLDILSSHASRTGDRAQTAKVKSLVHELIERCCGESASSGPPTSGMSQAQPQQGGPDAR